MKFSLILRPLCFIILLALTSFIVFKLCVMAKQIEHSETLQSIEVHNRCLSEIEGVARLLLPLESSTLNLSRALSSSLNGTELSFYGIQTKVAPTLFLALSTIPLVTEVTYLGLRGLLFSYYNDADQTLATFSNTSFPSYYYVRPFNRDTGKLYGQAVISNSVANVTLVQESLKRTMVDSSIGSGLNNLPNLMFRNTVAMDGRGFIRISFPTKMVIDHFGELHFHGGDFYLATPDGFVLVQSKLDEVKIVTENGSVAIQSLKPNNEGNHSLCNANDHNVIKSQAMNRVFYCSSLEILGVRSVYVLSFPINGKEDVIHKNSKLAVTLLVLLFVILVVALCIFIILMIKSARREMFLCAALIKQMDSTQQAERKSMNKSLAFAKASHDIRNALAAISGLIEVCQEDANPSSQLATSLVQMNTCTEDLLGILSSVLDRCKIEAGKMQLEEEEFNLAQLLEDVVDMFYPIGMKKDVDVVLDPCDGSILKLSHVKGDRGKLKQILWNLLSNAVKFTSEGHVSVRAFVNKTSKENAIIASNRNGIVNCLSALWCKKNGSLGDLEGIHTVQQDPNSMEFVFEVDDTGNGIPKDKQKSVFENFVQVTETALGLGGCGLGLGIVQSLVRLMGGEINIVDKEHGERGTCFRFNIFLATRDLHQMSDTEAQESYILNDGPSSGSHQNFGFNIRPSPLKPEGSHVLLLIAGDERRRLARKVIENLGIRVSIVKRTKHKLHLSQTSSGRTELRLYDDYLNKSASSNSNDGSASSDKEGQDLSSQPNYKKFGSRPSHNFVLIVIDSRAEPFPELCSIVANLKRDVKKFRCCKVVWLDNPTARNSFGKELETTDRPAPPCDHILSQPFHGSHLYRVLGLLPEFGGTYHNNVPRFKINRAHPMQHSRPQDSSVELTSSSLRPKHELQEKVVHKCDERSSHGNPLSGKKVLVVEDSPAFRSVATKQLSKLGAIVDSCENGKEAFDRVCKLLRDQSKEGVSDTVPYHYIFMDCQMPIMCGYEATKLIREEEKHYGIRIPIIALTANEAAEEVSKTKDAGMDFHLIKPLRLDKLSDAISFLQIAAERHSQEPPHSHE